MSEDHLHVKIALAPGDSERAAFTPLSPIKVGPTEGLKELEIASALAKEGDYYRAITAYKRALILLPKTPESIRDINYNIGMCYYFGRQYPLALQAFEKLKNTNPKWEAYADYLLAYYECLVQNNEPQKAAEVLEKLKSINPSLGDKASESGALMVGNLEILKNSKDPSLAHWTKELKHDFKSIKKAQVLNACLPGAGYLYLGKPNTALTSFLLNALFIAGSYRLFDKKHYALGALTTGLEFGWYFGGIYGAKESAIRYNQTIYQNETNALMKKKRLAPALMIRYAF